MVILSIVRNVLRFNNIEYYKFLLIDVFVYRARSPVGSFRSISYQKQI